MSDITNEQGGRANVHVILPTQAAGLEVHLRSIGQPESYYTSRYAFVLERSRRPMASAVQKLLSDAAKVVGVSLGKEHSTVVSLLDLADPEEAGGQEWSVLAFSSEGLDGMEAERVWATAVYLADEDLAALESPVRLVSGFDAPTQPSF